MYLLLLLFVAVVLIVVSTSRFRIHPFLALLFSAIFFGLLSGMPLSGIVESINKGFGSTIGSIGIVIIAGVIIGTFLEESGGAYAMAKHMLKITGKKRVSLTMAIVGYIVSIPVFCDSGFVILSPLNKALSKEAGLSLSGTAGALALGLMVTHVLVPPTPGPIAAAGILDADLGLVILMGLITSIPVLAIAWLFSAKISSRIWLDPNPEVSQEEIKQRLKEAPSAAKSFIPILLPILLIVLKSVSEFPTAPLGSGTLREILAFTGEPLIALLIGLVLSFSLPKKLDLEMLSTSGWVGKAMQNAALIILITGAGGAFGMMLRNSDLATVLGDSLSSWRIGIMLPFLLAAAIKTAQGSSTVALITTASLLAPMMPALGFDSDMARALTVLAIGAGGLVVSHSNDSMFWIVTQMSGMDVRTGYRIHSLGTLVSGCSAALLIWGLSLFLL
ncbi:MAG: gluconate transporter [Bacteroidetes bacterium]|nr:MAG: gluconate transporter [Bacteroidota bacterium]